MIYLDNAATTQLDPRVLESMMPYLTTQYGNAGALYKFGQAANEAIQEARARVARFIGSNPDNIIFTSGGSEANNLVFHGVKDYLKRIGRTHILVSAVEHDSVLRAAKNLIKDGFDVECIPVLNNGTVPSAAVERALRPDTGLVSVMYVNNETGGENPVSDIGSICLKRGILFHTDCVQAAGCHPIDIANIGCDFLSISAHKIHGPKGTGALYVKDASILSPLIYGGHDQEFGLRAGTENVAGIVGFGKACEIANAQQNEDRTIVSTLKQQFVTELQSHFDGDIVHINGTSLLSPGKTVNLRIDGVDNESLILMLDNMGVCISAGSACQSHESKPSHVLTAMGLTTEEARSSIRVSFSRLNTVDEVMDAAHIMASFIDVLRSHRTEEQGMTITSISTPYTSFGCI